jgi:hypothetical protein
MLDLTYAYNCNMLSSALCSCQVHIKFITVQPLVCPLCLTCNTCNYYTLLQVDAAAVARADRHLKEVLLALTERFQAGSATASSTAAAAAAAAAVPPIVAGSSSSSSGHGHVLSASQVRLWLSITGSSIQVRITVALCTNKGSQSRQQVS